MQRQVARPDAAVQTDIHNQRVRLDRGAVVEELFCGREEVDAVADPSVRIDKINTMPFRERLGECSGLLVVVDHVCFDEDRLGAEAGRDIVAGNGIEVDDGDMVV